MIRKTAAGRAFCFEDVLTYALGACVMMQQPCAHVDLSASCGTGGAYIRFVCIPADVHQEDVLQQVHIPLCEATCRERTGVSQ